MYLFRRLTLKACASVLLTVAVLLGSFSQVAAAGANDLCFEHGTGAFEAADNHTQTQKKLDQHGITHCWVMGILDQITYKDFDFSMKQKLILVNDSPHSSDFLFGVFRPPRLAV